MKTKIIITIVAGIVVIAGLAAIRHLRLKQKETAPLAAMVVPAVRTALVTPGRVVRTRHVLGAVVGGEETNLAPQIMARVLTVNVREGDVVHPDQVLVQLDDRELKDALAEGEASHAAAVVAERAQRDATARDQRLFEVKAIAQEQWDRSQASAAAATAQLQVSTHRLDQARTRLSYSSITAPTAGVVARRLADPGDLAVPGKPLLKLVRQQLVRVRAALPSEDFTSLRVGLPVTLSTDSQKVDTVVSRVFPAMGTSHLASFECDLANPPTGFVSGATIGVDVQLSSAEGLTVPTEALLEGIKGTWVFVVDQGTVRPVPIEVLDRSLEQIALKGALHAGESVVVAQPSRLMTLAAGMKVVVANNR